MIELGAHWQFIAAAYGGALVVVLGLMVWTLAESKRARARLKALEAARAGKAGR